MRESVSRSLGKKDFLCERRNLCCKTQHLVMKGLRDHCDIDVTVLQPAMLLDLRRRLDALQIFKSYCATMRLPPVLGVYGMHNTLDCL